MSATAADSDTAWTAARRMSVRCSIVTPDPSSTDCHAPKFGDLDGDGNKDIDTYGPPDPRARHAAAGLLAEIVPTARRIADAAGTEETFTGSHLDVLFWS